MVRISECEAAFGTRGYRHGLDYVRFARSGWTVREAWYPRQGCDGLDCFRSTTVKTKAASCGVRCNAGEVYRVASCARIGDDIPKVIDLPWL